MASIVAKNIRVHVHEDVAYPVSSLEKRIESIVFAMIKYVPELNALSKPVELTMKFSDNHTVQNLNKIYRGKDKPTNVLSFPNSDEEFPEDLAYENFGDIIFALETVQKEAEEQKKAFEDHLSHLMIHGVLHLCGYDHVEDDEAEEMEALEVRILQSLDIEDPYK